MVPEGSGHGVSDDGRLLDPEGRRLAKKDRPDDRQHGLLGEDAHDVCRAALPHEDRSEPRIPRPGRPKGVVDEDTVHGRLSPASAAKTEDGGPQRIGQAPEQLPHLGPRAGRLALL
jgi:hypothetical protein